MPDLFSARNLRILLALFSNVMLLSVALFVACNWRWPLVGDASILHYICFLMDRGMAPYRVVGDMNLPGTLMLEWTVMHTLGAGDLAWRVFDLLLLLAAAGSMRVITRPYGRLAGIFAASLFILAHGRDGVLQGGQRDLTIATLMLLATALLTVVLRSRSRMAMAAFGLVAGLAATIKPTALPFGAALFLVAVLTLARRRQPTWRLAQWAAPTYLIAPLACVIFLLQQHALPDFLLIARTLIPYYASLGHHPVGFLLMHSFSPFLPLVAAWLVLLALERPRLDAEHALLLAGALCGLASYLIQMRGYAYHRYPFLAFLLPLMAMDFMYALAGGLDWRLKTRRGLALAALAVGALFLAPFSAFSAHRAEWRNQQFVSSLDSNLERLGGAVLSGRIQCIDSISGCTTALYRERLVQSTGVIWDFLLFSPVENPVVARTQQDFLQVIEANPPQVMVVSAALNPSLNLGVAGDYAKLKLWPAFHQLLQTRYRLDTDWHPQGGGTWRGHGEQPDSYRIYVLNKP